MLTEWHGWRIGQILGNIQGYIYCQYTKQGTPQWHALRSEAIVTGSTANTALGLDTFGKMKEHFDIKINGTQAVKANKKKMAITRQCYIFIPEIVTTPALKIFYFKKRCKIKFRKHR